MGSKLFTEAELKSLNKRLKGDKSDSVTGIFYNRVKPKVKELLEQWLPRKKELKKLLDAKKKKGGKRASSHR